MRKASVREDRRLSGMFCSLISKIGISFDINHVFLIKLAKQILFLVIY